MNGLTNLQWNILAVVFFVFMSFVFMIQEGNIVAFIIYSTNTSGLPNATLQTTIGAYCLLRINSNQSALDSSTQDYYPEFTPPLAFGGIKIGEVGTPRQVTIWSNSSSTENITVNINGSNWECDSGACLNPIGQTLNYMVVNTTRFINNSDDSQTTGSQIDTVAEYNSNGIEVTSTASVIHANVAPNEARDAWFNILIPARTSPGIYKQNITYSWSC